MTGKVFVSCGMHLTGERDAALRVRELLKSKFNLRVYVAITVQSFDDIMTITKELRSSDYYLFIDFKRLSLFAHQELALAHDLGFGGNLIALRETGASDPQGFQRYVLSNPSSFNSTDELHESWRARIENRRPDVAAVGAVCILDSILSPSGGRQPSPDRGYLKWCGHSGYQRTLLPDSFEEVDVFAVRRDEPGLFLLSTLDSHPRRPIATENGGYELMYKVFARDFPVLEFTVRVDLQWRPLTPIVWTHQSEAHLPGHS